MALNTEGLRAAFTALFSDPPDTAAACASDWADALETYTQAVVPVSTTVSAAAEPLALALTATFQTSLSATQTAAEMELAFTQFATAVGLGMAPAFTAVPPALPVGFSDLFAERPETTAQAVNDFVDAIDTWMTTGTATRVSAPFDTVNWS